MSLKPFAALFVSAACLLVAALPAQASPLKSWSTSGDFSTWTLSGTGVTASSGISLATSGPGSTAVVPSNFFEDASVAWDPAGKKAYYFGGQSGGSSSNQIRIFDPAANTVSVSSTVMPFPVQDSAAVWDAAAGKAYVFGGSFSNHIVSYDPATNTAAALGVVLPFSIGYTSAVWDVTAGRAYVFGGAGKSGDRSEILVFDPLAGSVTVSTTSFSFAQDHPNDSVAWDPVGRKAYIMGGEDENGVPFNTIQVFDPVAGTLTTATGTLPQASAYGQAVWDPLGRKAYYLGGSDAGFNTHSWIYSYDPATGNVATSAVSLPAANVGASSFWDTDTQKAYLLGGNTDFSSPITTYSTFSPNSYAGSGSAYVNFAAGASSTWASLTKADAPSGQAIAYYAKPSPDGTCAGSGGSWAGWTALSFSGGSADLSGLAASSNLCLGVSLSTSDPLVTPYLSSLALSYAAVPAATPTPAATAAPAPTATPAASPAALAVTGFGGTLSGGTYSTASKRPSFSGKAPSGALVTVTVHSDPVTCGSVADVNGNWSCQLASDLPAGSHTVTVASGTASPITYALVVKPVLADTGSSTVPIEIVAGLLALAGAGLALRKKQA